MTKEEYLEIKAGAKVDAALCFEYWQANRKEGYKEFKDVQEFIPKFQEYLSGFQGVPIPAPDRHVTVLNIHSMMIKIYAFFDEKFNIIKTD